MEEKGTKDTVTRKQRKAEETQKEEKIIQLIVFHLGNEEFGADITQVREIIRKSTVTPIPDSPDFIEGVINIRGEIAVVINLKARFLLPTEEEGEEKHIVITEQEKTLFGLKVDEVTEVLRIPETDIKPTPELVTRIEEKYVKGVITLENRLIIMLDLSNVLSEEELARLTELSRKHRAIAETKKEEKKQRKEKEETTTTPKPPKTEEVITKKQTPADEGSYIGQAKMGKKTAAMEVREKIPSKNTSRIIAEENKKERGKKEKGKAHRYKR